MSDVARITTKRAFWTQEQLFMLRWLYPDYSAQEVAACLGRSQRAVYGKAEKLGLEKSAEFHASDRSARMKRGQQHQAARATQFKPGLTPWNKGKKGWCAEGSKATQFKAGRPATEARNYRPIGSLRLSVDGYLERKVSDDQRIASARRWVAEHRLVWQAHNGPIPAGHIVRFKPGMKTIVESEITIDRLECITRRENILRNNIERYPLEVRQLFQLHGAITRQVNQMAKENRNGSNDSGHA